MFSLRLMLFPTWFVISPLGSSFCSANRFAQFNLTNAHKCGLKHHNLYFFTDINTQMCYFNLVHTVKRCMCATAMHVVNVACHMMRITGQIVLNSACHHIMVNV